MLEDQLLKASSPRKSSLPSTASPRKSPSKKPKRLSHPILFSNRSPTRKQPFPGRSPKLSVHNPHPSSHRRSLMPKTAFFAKAFVLRFITVQNSQVFTITNIFLSSSSLTPPPLPPTPRSPLRSPMGHGELTASTHSAHAILQVLHPTLCSSVP